MENNSFKVNNTKTSIFKVVEDAFMVVRHIAESKTVKLVMPQLDDSDT